MNEITFLCIYQNISIVPVFYLQNIRNDAVCGLGSDKILTGLLEANVVLRSKVGNKELIQTFLVGFSDWVPGNCFRYHFYDSADVKWLSCTVTDRFIRKKLQLKVVSFEYFCK